MTAPSDVTANYVQIMRERNWSWYDLADQFDRDAAAGRALDGGENERRMARWARSQADAGRERREVLDPTTPPEVAVPEAPRRTAVPPRAPARRGGKGSTAARPRRAPAAPIVEVAAPDLAQPIDAVDAVADRDPVEG